MEIKLEVFQRAVKSLDELVNIDINNLKETLDEKIIDGLQNGMAQKFEICTELCWKTIKHFMLYNQGIDVKTPKQVIKEFYLSGFVDEEKYKTLLKILDDRNKLSHIYNEDNFKKIVDSFAGYIIIFYEVINIISKENS